MVVTSFNAYETRVLVELYKAFKFYTNMHYIKLTLESTQLHPFSFNLAGIGKLQHDDRSLGLGSHNSQLQLDQYQAPEDDIAGEVYKICGAGTLSVTRLRYNKTVIKPNPRLSTSTLRYSMTVKTHQYG